MWRRDARTRKRRNRQRFVMRSIAPPSSLYACEESPVMAIPRGDGQGRPFDLERVTVSITEQPHQLATTRRRPSGETCKNFGTAPVGPPRRSQNVRDRCDTRSCPPNPHDRSRRRHLSGTRRHTFVIALQVVPVSETAA